MPFEYPVVIFPIHKRSSAKYYADCEKDIEKKKRMMMSPLLGISFNDLSEDSKINFESHWFWPPWIVNDIIGFLEILFGNSNYLFGIIYLKRKLFPRHFPERLYRKYETTLKKNEYLYLSKTSKFSVIPTDNSSFIESFQYVVDQTNQILHSYVKNSKVWLPEIKFSHFNFVEAFKQVKEAIS